MSSDKDHAKANAAAWMSTIREHVAALDCDYDRLEELRDERADYAMDAPDGSAPWALENPEDAAELEELEAACKLDGEEVDAEKARERIEEAPLSVQVRGDWHDVGAVGDTPNEFCILLTTGGPALRLIGELDDHLQPSRARLEYQDWGTGWTEYFEPDSYDVLVRWANVFYFGD